MPYYLLQTASFARSFRKLDPQEKALVNKLILALTTYLDSNGALAEAQKIAPHFFFKLLQRPFYEAGMERKLRLVLRREGQSFAALFIGNHDDVERFLRSSCS